VDDDGMEDSTDGETETAYHKIQRILQTEGTDKLFPPLDGTAFYLNICKMNHSCDPNVYVKYCVVPNTGVCAQVMSIREIHADEELLQSYIDQSLPVKQRRQSLLDYGFHCTCHRCLKEETATL
jgi:hypothetical protein